VKKLLSVAAAGIVSAALVVLLQSCGILGGPALNVQVGAATDSTVQVVWTAPVEGAADNYLVYFKAVGETTFAFIGETTASVYTHDPHGYTGTYKVTSVFGSESYESPDKPTTIPVHTDTVTLFELNADSSRCGYGWNRDSGMADYYSMATTNSAGAVDFYISDFQQGYGASPYALVSPDKADSIDQGAVGIVPEALWRSNGFSNLLGGEEDPLPAFRTAPPNYFIYTELNQLPALVGVYTAGDIEKHYALVKVHEFSTATGACRVESWFQMVQGLRLIRHTR
jgi:hypothetical protein